MRLWKNDNDNGVKNQIYSKIMFLLFGDAIIDFFLLLSKMCMLTGNLEGGSKIYNKKTCESHQLGIGIITVQIYSEKC